MEDNRKDKKPHNCGLVETGRDGNPLRRKTCDIPNSEVGTRNTKKILGIKKAPR
jgi:hypothetical protein